MPPALRPTPSAPSTPRTSTKSNTDSESPARTPRKSPHCKTCGRPRKGHPLRACESADSSLKNTTTATETPTSTLIDALAAMDLVERDRKDKRDRRQSVRPRPLQSLPSISTVTGELLESLKAPGLLDDDDSDYGGDDAEKRDVVIRWREVSSLPAGKDAAQRLDSSIPPRSTTPSRRPPALLGDDFTPTKKQHGGK